MTKGAFARITFPLAIIMLYTYLFGMVGTVEGIPSEPETTTSAVEQETDEQTDSDNADAAAETTAATVSIGISFPEYGTLDVSNERKPQIGANYVAPETGESLTTPTEATTTEATTPDFEIDDSIYTTTTEATTTAPPETTTSITFSTEEVDDLEPDPDAAETEKEPSNSAGGEKLTVYYTGSGGDVTGDAADILAQVVMGEIGGSFNEEAIKAQAVAAYTYIKYYNDNGNSPYVAVRAPNDTVRSCVNDVLGQAIYYGDSLIQSVYCASTAGYSASSENVWGVAYPYLVSSVRELDALYDPNYGVKNTFTSTEVQQLVERNTGIVLEGDPGTWFAIKNYVDTVYVGEMTIGGNSTYTNSSGREVTITGRVMREQIMEFGLRSACFEISYNSDSDRFTFTTYGYGHGVGLSQYGANNLASYWGYDYRQIIEYFFPGTTIK